MVWEKNYLLDGLWEIAQREFAGREGHSCDLMALESNAMRDVHGNPIPHFTPISRIIWCKSLHASFCFLRSSYYHAVRFPPYGPNGAFLKFLHSYRQSCTAVVLEMFPILASKALNSKRLAVQGNSSALLVPSRKGWLPHIMGIPGDL